MEEDEGVEDAERGKDGSSTEDSSRAANDPPSSTGRRCGAAAAVAAVAPPPLGGRLTRSFSRRAFLYPSYEWS